ncbi:gb [Venturia nashicola]|uniref:Gb n=1 Tax=Venturia nashicola TaxID=86259 RepID=A0A4Z1P9W1_9PEZI|nr:gb [Venturia nashicola]TLD27824.1 gb [Venturia nashicola]
MGGPANPQLKPPQPSRFQLALALAIAKAKPGGISVRDYLVKIRHHILEGSRVANYGSADEYLDAAAYWHDMFKESQIEIHGLQTQMVKLERVNERLKASDASGGVAAPQQPEGDSPDVEADMRKGPVPPGFKDVTAPKKGTKRKQDEAKVKSSARPNKKVASNNEPLPSTLVNGSLIDDLGVFDVPGAGSTTVLHLFRAHKLYQQTDSDPQDLAYHLTQAATNLADHVSTIGKQIQKHILDATATQDKRLRAQLVSFATSKTDTDFPRILRAAGRSFMSLFHGLATMWEKDTEAAKRHHGATTYQYIKAFDTLLLAISSNCMLIAQLNAQQIANDAPSPSAAAKKSGEKKVQKSKTATKARIAQEIVSLLLALLTHLTPARQGPHTAFFEGILYLLLERTGKRLYLITFNRERGATLEDEMIDGPSPSAAQLGTVERQAISVEVKFLVQLLERAMSLAPSFLGSLSGVEVPAKSGRGAARVKFTGLPKRTAALSISAKEKLQRTLVECMFGSAQLSKRNISKGNDGNREDEETEDEDEQETNNEFIEVLRKPVFTGPVPQMPKVEEVDVPEWFTENVWKLVGWDVLGWGGDF